MLLVISKIIFAVDAEQPKRTLTGKITDQSTGESLAGVVIYFPDLKTGIATDINGNYEIANLPQAKVLTQVSYLGYKTIVETIDLTNITSRDYTMEPSVVEMHEVVVTGTSRATEIKSNPVPIASIDKKQIEQNISTNIIEAITKLPGINAVTTGPNVSKPFIRGLGYNRILTLYDGMRQEGQQWGDEHGIEVDEYNVDRVEVIKGPASLTYGSDALAGVVNLLPVAPLANGLIKGSIITEYQSNNGLLGGSASLAGNKSGFIWGGRLSHKLASNYRNKYDGRVYGTAFQETDANAYLGLNKQWGYSHLNIAMFNDLQEIPDGSRDSATRKFTKQITEFDAFRPIVSDAELNSYQIATLHQHVQHYKIYLTNNFFFGERKLGVNLGFQQNIRQEFSHPLAVGTPGLDLVLNTYTYDLKYYLPENKGWETTFGVNGMFQNNKNKGTEFIIPDYNLFDVGPFALITKTSDKWNLSTGLRFDNRFFSNNGMYIRTNPETSFNTQVSIHDTVGAEHPFSNFKHTFSGLSASLGVTYSLNSHLSLKANVARGFRAPNIAEISSNGVHPGSNIYQIGNSEFKPEFSLQEDIGIFYAKGHVSGSLEIFNNSISNYIFNQKMLNHLGADSIIIQGNQTFKFQQAQAELYGGEASLDVHPHPLDWLHFENSISLIYAKNLGGNGVHITDSSRCLPLIPPLHTHSELRADLKKYKHVASLFAKIEMDYYAKQSRVYLAENTEAVTPGYKLFNIGFGGDVTNLKGKVLFTFDILCSNIFDVVYQSHLSRLKYFEPYPNNSSGRNGIYNMGRNISFKLNIPLDFKG